MNDRESGDNSRLLVGFSLAQKGVGQVIVAM